MVVFGTRLYGKVERCGGTYVATRFAHVSSIPVLPLGSVLVLEDLDERRRHAVPIAWHAGSTSLALLRAWGTTSALLAMVGSICVLAAPREDERAMPLCCATLLLVALVALGWTRLGRLSVDERAQRFAYGTFVDHPIDVAMVPDSHDQLRSLVGPILLRGARAQGAAGSGDLHRIDLASDDRRYLEAALLYTRLEWSRAGRSARRELSTLHGAIWERLKVVDPCAIELAADAD